MMTKKEQLTKRKQLKTVFKVMIKDLLCKLSFDINVTADIVNTSISETANLMLKEVSIRTPLK